MTAPSTFANASHDGRYDVDVPDATELVNAPTPGRSGVVFPARYAGRCAGCGNGITPGESITRGLDDGFEHAECGPDKLTIPVQGVCDRCYLVLPLTGVCGVCE